MPSDMLTRLRVLRAERHVTQEQVAQDLGLAQATYNGIERGRQTPTLPTLIALADYFHVSIDFIIGRSDNRR
jgi:transcriptional regulator with XRE-family HTH domain